MAGRARDTRNRISAKQEADRSDPYTLPLFPAEEEISICDVFSRLCPGIDQGQILQHLREDATRRQERVQKLRRQILAGDYQVHPREVATAILLEGELLLH